MEADLHIGKEGLVLTCVSPVWHLTCEQELCGNAMCAAENTSQCLLTVSLGCFSLVTACFIDTSSTCETMVKTGVYYMWSSVSVATARMGHARRLSIRVTCGCLCA